jgi:hypothetical protein
MNLFTKLSLETLPLDVLYYFLSKFPPEILCRIACLSKFWREMSTDARIWKKLCLARWIIDGQNLQPPPPPSLPSPSLPNNQLFLQSPSQTETYHQNYFYEGMKWKELYRQKFELFKPYARLTNAATEALWNVIMSDTSTYPWAKVSTQCSKYERLFLCARSYRREPLSFSSVTTIDT